MGQILENVELSDYVTILRTITKRGGRLKSVMIGQLNPTGAPEEITLDNLAATKFLEFHVMAEVEHGFRSGLATYYEKYHYWKISHDKIIKTWLEIEGSTAVKYEIRKY